MQKSTIEKKRVINNISSTSKGEETMGSGLGTTSQNVSQSQYQKQIKILENRLEKANSKFNESIAQNKVMREEIDNLRKEKVIFENVYAKLETQLGEKRRDVANIIEVANSSYEERDKVQEKLATLISQSEKEQAEFTKEIKAVQDLIDKDDQM